MQPDREHLQQTIKEALKAVKFPGYSRDIVSFGVVKDITASNGAVSVNLELNSAKAETAFQVQADAAKVVKALPQLQGLEVKIEVTSRPESHAHSSDGQGAALSPLQDEVQQEGRVFDPDPLIAATIRPDLAPGAGYDEDGPPPLGGPTGDRTSIKWHGQVPVFQWEIDPADPARQQYGESEVERGGWIFRIWWQVHPAGLVYASISAISEEEEERPQARQHPIGRNVAVNLVYDLRRQGVVAIYGTALDFRPFVEVFLEGFGFAKLNEAGESLPAEEKKT
ncbi:MAG: iron-sulfur cluster assembly protein [Verrucomicrobiota bacterium]